MKVNIMDMSKEFEVSQASNGGFIVSGRSKAATTFGQDGGCTAAFTTPGEMLVWLAGNYGLRIEQLFAEGAPRVSVSSPLVGERAGESVVSKSPGNNSWIKFDNVDDPPELPRCAPIQLDYGQGQYDCTLTENVNWQRVIAYRLV
jgi:hypothetical protein